MLVFSLIIGGLLRIWVLFSPKLGTFYPKAAYFLGKRSAASTKKHRTFFLEVLVFFEIRCCPWGNWVLGVSIRGNVLDVAVSQSCTFVL